MKAKELDERFDSGEDITGYLDLDRARRPAREPKRVNVDFPIWMVHSLDKEARRLGVTPTIHYQVLDRGKTETGVVLKRRGGK